MGARTLRVYAMNASCAACVLKGGRLEHFPAAACCSGLRAVEKTKALGRQNLSVLVCFGGRGGCAVSPRLRRGRVCLGQVEGGGHRLAPPALRGDAHGRGGAPRGRSGGAAGGPRRRVGAVLMAVRHRRCGSSGGSSSGGVAR